MDKPRHTESQKRRTLEQIAEVKRAFLAAEHAVRQSMPAVVLVTSASQGEGKSLTAAVLAGAAAEAGGRRVALLDLNWYRPALHQLFDLTLEHSWEVMADAGLKQLMRPSGKASIDVLTAPTDHAEQPWVSDQAFARIERLVAEARQNYDLTIIDSAAVFPTNRLMMDPVMLSRATDGVLTVVLKAVTSKSQVRRAHKTLEAAGARMIGAVTNRWRATPRALAAQLASALETRNHGLST